MLAIDLRRRKADADDAVVIAVFVRFASREARRKTVLSADRRHCVSRSREALRRTPPGLRRRTSAARFRAERSADPWRARRGRDKSPASCRDTPDRTLTSCSILPCTRLTAIGSPLARVHSTAASAMPPARDQRDRRAARRPRRAASGCLQRGRRVHQQRRRCGDREADQKHAADRRVSCERTADLRVAGREPGKARVPGAVQPFGDRPRARGDRQARRRARPAPAARLIQPASAANNDR